MYSILALFRASWLTASSYKVSTAFSLIGALVGILPLFFVSNALQPFMADVIKGEGTQYFGFLLIGTLTYRFTGVAVRTLPGVVGSALSSGTLEVVLGSPTPVPTLLAGMVSYSYLWVVIRTGILLVAGALLGIGLVWSQLPVAVLILGLIVLVHTMLGILFAAVFLIFRTTGPVPALVLVGSSLLGGVYYPTHVIPSWLEHLSALVPLSYGLRAMRRVVLDGASLSAVAGDLFALGGFLIVLTAVGVWSFTFALRHVRQSGSLGYY